jgi:hypothetical protein
MAPVLQCPDCGAKHPLSEVPSAGAFPCKGCGRVLRVPERVTQRSREAQPVSAAPTSPAPVGPAAAVPPPAPVARETEVTSAAPVVEPGARASTADARAARALAGPRLAAVPWWLRLLVWIVAIPIGFMIVFGFARTFGLFNNDQLSDLFLANGSDRFWPVARLLPFVALVVALLVQGGIYLLARWRANRRAARTPSPAR